MRGKHMIVLSLDAVGSRDLTYMRTLPNFRAFLERAAGCEQVRSVYPSLTYPAHTSIVTGRYPKNHGIVNNFPVQPERNPSDWFWQRRYVRGTTLYDEAAGSGMKVAALLWPVMGKAKIACNLPEVLPNRPWQNQIMVSVLNGTPLYELKLQRRFGHLRDGVRQPQLDNFVHQSMLYTLKTERPDLLLVHLTDVDTNRHQYGVETPEVTAALRRHDERLGELMETLEVMGWRDETNLVILGDHYQRDVTCAVCPNHVLLRKGYFTAKGGRVTSWRAIARDSDGSCYIYVKAREDEAEIRRILEEMKAKEDSGIERIFTGEEAAFMGADPECAFMLEASEGYYFQNGWETYRIQAGPGSYLENPHIQAATHGYLPEKPGYQTIFFAAGPDFAEGKRIESMSLVDEGPTLAQALGLELKKADGRIIWEIFKK